MRKRDFSVHRLKAAEKLDWVEKPSKKPSYFTLRCQKREGPRSRATTSKRLLSSPLGVGNFHAEFSERAAAS